MFANLPSNFALNDQLTHVVYELVCFELTQSRPLSNKFNQQKLLRQVRRLNELTQMRQEYKLAAWSVSAEPSHAGQLGRQRRF